MDTIQKMSCPICGEERKTDLHIRDNKITVEGITKCTDQIKESSTQYDKKIERIFDVYHCSTCGCYWTVDTSTNRVEKIFDNIS